ncbi:L-ascorbate oxidase homolog [Andrographis paniculata]|uniref:L-ascorbate oxidase homolog n=1 Tax=Andrographis paniculata TaxID=175694 RepID=UPI0021E77CB9|nr:L-ascorbate oxidase homolog [Andrographis paniculata]XP_051140154.1 L-ascorbate oxidase homolog [Andrographis paniculata]
MNSNRPTRRYHQHHPFWIRMVVVVALAAALGVVRAEDPYLFFRWEVEYATLSPLGSPQQVITINKQFPGPRINCTTNNNLVVNVFNHLDEPLLFTWNGIQQRKNSWQEGMPGTNCPIPPGANYTYRFQAKDQIGSYYYYPTTSLHRAAGGYGPITIHSRPLIPVPFPPPEDEHVVLAGDWYSDGHVSLRKKLDSGRTLSRPDGVIINGRRGEDAPDQPMFFMAAGKTYRYRICNVGMKNSINVRIQGHTLKLVEVEGSHTVQNTYDSVDVHLGQCYSVLVTADQTPKDYLLVASTRFTKSPLATTAIVRYNGSSIPASKDLPKAPEGWAWSLSQFRSLRWNLTASAARPNPQGSYHYGKINITRTIKLVNSANTVDGKLRYAVNGVSHVNSDTPVKLAEYFGVAAKVFKYDLVRDEPAADAENKITVAPSVVNVTFRDFVEIVFENHEKSIQAWHLSGYSFFATAIEPGRWTPEKRKGYNLIDAVSRHTVQVYPGCWAAIMTTFDNCGMWSLRSVALERQYLGQQLYISAQSPVRSARDEYPVPADLPLCGVVKGLTPPATP